MFDPEFFRTDGPFDDFYRKFVDWAKVPAPVVQVRLKDGRHFWVNRTITSDAYSQGAIFFQEVEKNYRVAFIVPYENIEYIVLHSDVPPEYRRIPEKKRPPAGFRAHPEEGKPQS